MQSRLTLEVALNCTACLSTRGADALAEEFKMAVFDVLEHECADFDEVKIIARGDAAAKVTVTAEWEDGLESQIADVLRKNINGDVADIVVTIQALDA